MARFGPEIDFVIDFAHRYVLIEVKWSENPGLVDTAHLQKFMQEYQSEIAYVVCRTPKHYKISDRIIALPWQNLHEILSELH